jgi:mannose-6-phosphate isomerase-like protein (cupin superfamily)
MAGYRHVKQATAIPAPGGKRIEEIVGRVSTQSSSVSVAHMVAPAGWDEPPQTPAFAEITVMVRGRMRVELGPPGSTEVVELAEGEAIHVEAGTRVRYANPHGEESEYYAICLPAFSPETVHRED